MTEARADGGGVSARASAVVEQYRDRARELHRAACDADVRSQERIAILLADEAGKVGLTVITRRDIEAIERIVGERIARIDAPPPPGTFWLSLAVETSRGWESSAIAVEV